MTPSATDTTKALAFVAAFAAVVTITLSVALAVVYLDGDPHPPHVAPPVAAAPEVLFTDAQAVDLWVWIEGERRETERLERLAAEEASRVAPARGTPSVSMVSAGTPVECEGLAIPAAIAWRESRCTRGIDTGNGFLGAYQVAAFHWFGGLCDGLSWLIPEQEDECARRLMEGSGLRPWGG